MARFGYDGWAPYVPVAQRRNQALREAAKAARNGEVLDPVAPYSGSVSKSFWGRSWCSNLERYSDYENRLPRGRTYVRNGSVIDLKLRPGEVQAQVMGSHLYEVTVHVAPLPEKQWKALCRECSGSIDSLVELLRGRLSNAVMEVICRPGTGLFPAPKEIQFDCSCPDSARMCKHVAAVLYGVGARLDQRPELLFQLRHVQALDLISQAGAELPSITAAARPGKSAKLLQNQALGEMFGIDIATTSEPAPHTNTPQPRQLVRVPPKEADEVSAPARGATSAAKAGAKKAVKKPAKTVVKRAPARGMPPPAPLPSAQSLASQLNDFLTSSMARSKAAAASAKPSRRKKLKP